MKIEDLKTNIENYQNSIEEVKKKRDYWNSNAKSLIKESLTKVKEEYDLGWSVQELNWAKNWEGVNITFGNRPSGIVEHLDNRTKSYIKKGGTLTFSQGYNGDISVIIIYPEIEELVSSTIPHKIIDNIDPNSMTEDYIINQVSNFIIEMTKWETTKSINTLGFR